jgi:hypothetical protein
MMQLVIIYDDRQIQAMNPCLVILNAILYPTEKSDEPFLHTSNCSNYV